MYILIIGELCFMGRWSMVSSSSCLPLTSLVHVWSLSRLSWGDGQHVATVSLPTMDGKVKIEPKFLALLMIFMHMSWCDWMGLDVIGSAECIMVWFDLVCPGVILVHDTSISWDQERQDLKLQIFDENVLRQDRYFRCGIGNQWVGWDMG